MNETLTITKFKTCFGCNYQAETTETKCPNCQKPLQDESTIRILGGLLMFIGLLLVGVMSAIMLWMNKTMNNPSSTTKFTVTSDKKMITFLILGAVAAFGFSAFIAGSYQLFTGKRNKKLIWLMLGLWIVLIVAANVIPNIF
jgi:magnesium-transporting ATPase (P-type)